MEATEPSAFGATVGTLTATDDDEAGTVNSALTYTVITGDALPPGNFLTMNGANLELVQVGFSLFRKYNNYCCIIVTVHILSNFTFFVM